MRNRKRQKEMEAKLKNQAKYPNEEETKSDDDDINMVPCEEGMVSPPITGSKKFG
jgi:hypothetical protein